MFTGRKIGCHDGNTGRYKHIPLQMGIRNVLAPTQPINCLRRKKENNAGKSASVFSHKNTN